MENVLIKFSHVDEDFVFEEQLTGGSVPKSYIPAAEKGWHIQFNIISGKH